MMDGLNWQIDCPLPLQHNLYRTAQSSSLTAALNEYDAVFSVRLCELGETQSFEIFKDFRLPETMFARRVSLCLNDTAVVDAVSLCDTSSHWREILHCGNISLGTILFSGSLKWSRSAIEFATPPDCILARRSWFERQGERLYLAEFFLPPIEKFRKKHSPHGANSV